MLLGALLFGERTDRRRRWGLLVILQGKLKAGLWYDMDRPVPLDRIAEAYDSLRKHEALKYLIKLNKE